MMSLLRHAFTLATALSSVVKAQYDDGYQNISSAVQPVQMRLAYQGPNAMGVSWNTFSQLTNPTVNYGLTPDALTQTASSSISVTYPTSLTYNNHVNITGLLPFTTYYYLPQNSNTTTPYSFTTARAAGDTTPYTIAVVVDMGTFGPLGLSSTTGTNAANPLAVNEQTTINALYNSINNYEFLVQAGDMAYADAWLKEEAGGYLPNTTAQGVLLYEQILNSFYDELSPITSQKALMVNPGNHEANCDNGGSTVNGVKYTTSICPAGQSNFTGYINHWRMPSGPSGGLGNFWYSYDYGLTHFIHLDMETDLGAGLAGPSETAGGTENAGPFGTTNQQVNWLANDLASVNRTLTPWVVVFGHRGFYLSATSSNCANCKTAFEKMFWQYNVDLYVNGHAHLYERTAPIYNGVIDPAGLNNPNSTFYITNGAAGHYDGLDSFSGTLAPQSEYFENSDYAYSTLTFHNATHMTVDTMWSRNSTLFDTATLYKSRVLAAASNSTSNSTSTSSASTIASSTVSAASPSSSTGNFNGQGHLFIYSNNMQDGDIGSAGTWYNLAGQNVATYTAVPVPSGDGTTFYLEHSGVYCAIAASDSSLSCTASSTSGASVFGQTTDGNLTYLGSPAFYASSSAVGSARPTIYATSLPVSLNIAWGATNPPFTNTVAVPAASSTSGSSSSSSSSKAAKTTSVTAGSTTSFANSTTAAPGSTALGSTASTSSSAVSTSSTALATSNSTTSAATSSVATAGNAVTITVTQPASTVTATMTVSTTATTTATDIEIDSITSTQSVTVVSVQTQTSTEVDSVTFTQSITSVSTEIDMVTATVTQSTTATEVDTITQSTTATEIDTITQSTIATEIDTITNTQTALVTITQSTTATEVDTVTTTQTASVTIVDSTTTTETDSTTFTQPASTLYVTMPASTSVVTQTQPASTLYVTQPASTSVITQTQPASTVYVTQPASTSVVTQPASTVYITQPASTSVVTQTQPASTVYVTQTQPASTSVITQTQPASTVTITSAQKTATVVSTTTATSTLTQPKATTTFTATTTRTQTSVSITTATVTTTKKNNGKGDN